MGCNTVLEIRKGVPKTPGDTLSAEEGIDALNLLDPGGYSLDEWTMRYAGMKGGVWADSPLSAGRTLMAGEDGNVTESMSVVLSAPDMQTMGVKLSHLMRLRQDIKDFWTGVSIEPVYLVNRQTGEPGNRYALIYNLEVALQSEPVEDDGRIIRDFSLSLEREPYWRSIPPGANPKLWTFQVTDHTPTLDHYNLFAEPNLVLETVSNKLEWAAAAQGAQSTLLSQNYVDIPAALIPGDAPALLQFSVAGVTDNVSTRHQIIVGLSSKNTEAVNHNNDTIKNALVLAAGDAQAGPTTKTVGTVDTGLRSNGSSAVYYFVRAGASKTISLKWGTSDADNYLKLDKHLLRGRYAAYVRASLPTDGVGTASLTLIEIGQTAPSPGVYYTLPAAPLNEYVSAGYALTYIGTVTIPLGEKANVALNGYGVQIRETSGNFEIDLTLVNTGTAGDFDALDLILIPIDEGAAVITTGLVGTDQDDYFIVYDATGYLNRGEHLAVAKSYITDIDTGGLICEVQGDDLHLNPGMDYRLHLLVVNLASTTFEPFADPNSTTPPTVRLNIVPRWIGLRSE